MRLAGDVPAHHQGDSLLKCLQPGMAQAGQMAKGLKYRTGETLLHAPAYRPSRNIQKEEGGMAEDRKKKGRIPL